MTNERRSSDPKGADDGRSRARARGPDPRAQKLTRAVPPGSTFVPCDALDPSSRLHVTRTLPAGTDATTGVGPMLAPFTVTFTQCPPLAFTRTLPVPVGVGGVSFSVVLSGGGASVCLGMTCLNFFVSPCLPTKLNVF